MPNKRGRKAKPELIRYDAADVGPAVYLVEAGEMIKVGRSDVPACRLKTLHTSLAARGLTLGRVHLFPGGGASISGLEAACIRALGAIATSRPSIRSEYFYGISFERGVAVVAALHKATKSRAKNQRLISSKPLMEPSKGGICAANPITNRP